MNRKGIQDTLSGSSVHSVISS